MNNTDFSKIKGQTPVSIIVHGGTYTGYLLSKTLLEQGSQVIIIDKYTSESKTYFSDLKKSGKVSFIDFKGLKNFYEKISRIDYLYYFLQEDEREVIESKDFLSESDYLNTSLIASNKYKAKIALITSLKLNRELSNRINNDNLSQPSPYSRLELQRYCENLVAEFGDKTKANIRIIRLGTIIGKGIKKIQDNILHKLFTEATVKTQIEIIGEGLEVHNLIHESDAIYGILKLMFTDSTKGEVISLCNKNDYTTLSLAYKLLELDVEAKAIRFVEQTNLKPILQDLYVPAPNASNFGWTQQVNLEKSVLEQVQSYYESHDKKWVVEETYVPKKSEEKLSNTKTTPLGNILNSITSPFKKLTDPKKLFTNISYLTILKLIIFISVSILSIYFLIAPVIGISIGSYIVYNNSKQLYSDVQSLDFENIQSRSKTISSNLDRLENNISNIYWIFRITNTQDTYRNYIQILQGTDYALDSAQDLVTGLQPLGMYFKDFEPAISFDNSPSNQTREYRDYLKAINSNQYSIREGVYKMSLAQNLIDTVDTKKLPKVMQEYVLQYKDLINSTAQSVKPLQEVTQFLPDLLGVDERKRYLILLQNEGEIRSTGGWISSYAIVAIEGGQIRELFVDDIYNADGTLKVQGNTYKTPSSMIKALGETPYTFSLVNWNPNLDNVLLSSEQFIYDLGKGDDLDGVITIDTMFVQKLLDKWGGIEVPGESELITSSNLYSKIFEMHNEFTPGSNRKSTFLANLADQTVTKIFSSDFNDYKDIADVIVESLDEKHVQATFKNTLARSYLDTNNWDGNLDSKYLSTPINIDWNWGANKANLYLKKNHTLDIDIKDENTVDYTYQIAIQNDSTKDEYPEGVYTNYIRIYIPQGAQLMSIKGLEDNKYDMYDENGYKVVGGWFKVNIQSNNTFEISYRVSKDNNYFPIKKDSNTYSLDLNIYKQPGSKKDAYTLNIGYPQNWILGASENLSTIGNELNRRFDLAQDQEFKITWSK